MKKASSALVAVTAVRNMSSRIIRGDFRLQRSKVTTVTEESSRGGSQDRVMDIEKEAFEQGYAEGERIGKEMGENMVAAVVKRYDTSIGQIAQAHKSLVEAMEEQTVQLALEIARRVVQRELTIDPDLVTALASVALKRVANHQSLMLRVSRHDFGRVRVAVGSINPAVTVKDDASFDRGDFVIDSAQTHLDGRIGSQIDAISRSLFDE